MLDDKYLLTLSVQSGEENSENISLKHAKSLQKPRSSFSKAQIKILAMARASKDSKAAPSIIFLAKREKWFFQCQVKKVTTVIFRNLGGFSLKLYNLSIQIAIVSLHKK